MRARITALLLLFAAGCASNRARGPIDGVEIDVKSALFFSQSEALGEDGLVTVILSDLKDSCQDYGYYIEATKDMEAADDLAGAWAAIFPPDFWEIAIIMRVEDPAVPLDGAHVTGLDWDETLEERNHGFATFVHNKTFRDSAYFDGTGPTSDYLDDYLSRGGRIEVDKHLPGSMIRGNFGTEVVDAEDGEHVGLVRMNFKAPFCDVDIL